MHGFIPASFKRAAITPVIKSPHVIIGLYNLLLPLLVFERIVRKQMVAFLTRRGDLNNTQHGFRMVVLAFLCVFDDRMHMLNSDCTVDMIYLDFSKVFDKVDHGILLHKLKDLGITGKLGIWFFQFLTNKTHYVRLPSGLSQNSPVLNGVPQGTVLGPQLFLIIIFDINKDIISSKVISFADDTRVYSTITQSDDCDNLQSDLQIIYNWALYNNMFFNSQKFHCVSYCSSLTLNSTNTYVNPDLEITNPTNNVLDLGIFMSADCSFEFHIKSIQTFPVGS